MRLIVVGLSLYASKEIRMLAVHNYGYVIHEFDPWFNFRATQYMYAPPPPMCASQSLGMKCLD